MHLALTRQVGKTNFEKYVYSLYIYTVSEPKHAYYIDLKVRSTEQYNYTSHNNKASIIVSVSSFFFFFIPRSKTLYGPQQCVGIFTSFFIDFVFRTFSLFLFFYFGAILLPNYIAYMTMSFEQIRHVQIRAKQVPKCILNTKYEITFKMCVLKRFMQHI